MSSHAGPAGSWASWHISSTIVPSGASIVKCGQPTTCSASSNVAANALAVAGRGAAARSPVAVRRVATGSRSIWNEPGMRKSNQSAGSRSHSTRPDSASRAAGTSLSRSERDLPQPQRALGRGRPDPSSRCPGSRCTPERLVGRAAEHGRRDPVVVAAEIRACPSRTDAAARRTPPGARAGTTACTGRADGPGRAGTATNGSETTRCVRRPACSIEARNIKPGLPAGHVPSPMP